MGCFWCAEDAFEGQPGVLSVVSGYTGGKEKNPTYEQVSAHRTGHHEAIEVVFDPSKTSYEQLLDVFWHNVDPTTDGSGQFCDRGDQYRSAIFVHDDEQRRLAEASRQTRGARSSARWSTLIVAAGDLLHGRGLPPGLRQEEPAALRLLQQELWPRRAAARGVGRGGGRPALTICRAQAAQRFAARPPDRVSLTAPRVRARAPLDGPSYVSALTRPDSAVS